MKKIIFILSLQLMIQLHLFSSNTRLDFNQPAQDLNSYTDVPPQKYPFDGIWRISNQGSGDITISTYFVLQQSENKLVGTVIINNSVEIPIKNVKLSDNKASFGIFWGAEYTITPEKDRLIVLTSWNDNPPSSAIAVRVPKEETIAPIPIPLPEIKNLPSNGLTLTPPMGWNSWNYIGIEVSDKVVRETADAMVKSGMAKAGYKYIVIDDGWEGGRDAQGNIYPNEKFPDMKKLADYVHGLGLKLGIYSSPGPRTCGGYIGSYGYESEDAKTFASWGIDYLKYDWCGAMRIYPDSLMQRAYQKMGSALLNCGRPIVYSLCQYGLENVWEWGTKVGANLWRTTGDISDSWERISEIGFNQSNLSDYAGPGHWNDPDMLEVGNGHLTYEENKSHFTLWCMLSAPLMAGNDLRKMSDKTLSILTNKDLIAINQDILGIQAKCIAKKDSIEIWLKPLKNGGRAVAIFNRSEKHVKLNYNWIELGWDKKPKFVRNIWENKKFNLLKSALKFEIPSHGVMLLEGK